MGRFSLRSKSLCDAIDLQLGARLRRRRRLLGLTQHELGLACGLRFQQIQKYESATNRISAAMLWRLARALDVEAGYFYVGLVGDDDRATVAPTVDRRFADGAH